MMPYLNNRMGFVPYVVNRLNQVFHCLSITAMRPERLGGSFIPYVTPFLGWQGIPQVD